MAEYKVVNASQLDSDLATIANAIRERSGTSLNMVFPEGFVDTIRNIPVDTGASNEIEADSLSQVYYWTKTRAIGNTINETYKSGDIMLGASSDTVQYADEVVLEGNNLVLVNPRDYTLTTDDDAAEEVLVGKYVYALSKFYRIPSDARIIYNAPTQYTPGFMKVSKVYELSATIGTDECTIIVSDDINAYPENGVQDGCTYVYQGSVAVALPALPTLNNPAAASDLASGKELIDANGNTVTGTLKDGGDMTVVGGTLGLYKEFGGTSGVSTSANVETDRILRAGDKVSVVTAWDNFGDARPEDVAKGKKFTSATGLLVDGTHECDGGVTLPTLTNPASASDMALDKQLIDADGNVVTGTLGEIAEGENFIQSSNVKLSVGQMLVAQVPFSPRSGVEGAILRPGANIALRTPAENLGNATAADVAAGKTFTSAAGLLVEGTLAESGVGTRIWATDDIGYYDGNVGSTKFHIGGVYAKNNIGSDTYHGFVCRPGAEFWLRNVPSSLFGDATAEDVAAGKTFTSAAGLLVTGTASGGSSDGLLYDMGEFVLDSDTTVVNDAIQHSLGERPEFIVVWTDDYAGKTNPDTMYATALGFVWLDGFMGLDNWYTSAVSGTGRGTTVTFSQNKNSTGMNVVKPTSAAYTVEPNDVSESQFKLCKVGNNIYWRAGTKYKYFVSKAWWTVGGGASAE